MAGIGFSMISIGSMQKAWCLGARGRLKKLASIERFEEAAGITLAPNIINKKAADDIADAFGVLYTGRIAR